MDSQCFAPVEIGTPAEASAARALEGTRVWRIVCP
jgi:hypothetical protein